MDNDIRLKKALLPLLKECGVDASESEIVIERSKDSAHGDYATNCAMKFAKRAGKNPKAFAQEIADKLSLDFVEKVEIAGPGFINFFLKHGALTDVLSKVFEQGSSFGRAEKNGKTIDIEYVSANPTGDLHLGHTRCAAVGDVISTLLDWAGYDVTREFYVNDCGNQVEHLGHSIRARYHEAFGEPLDLADDDYHGTDLIAIANAIKEKYGDKYLKDDQESHDFFIRFGIDAELGKIWKDMDAFRVHFDKVTYESDIRKGGNIEKTLAELKDKGYVYAQDGAMYLATTKFVDDKDRPIVKSNGLYTYFMPDICYHYNKMERGYSHLIDVLGADHHGYIGRMKSALMMKGYSEDSLEPVFVQVVRVYKDGQEVKMSKRTGKAIAHRDLIEDVGVDAVRYFFVERSPSSHLDFNYNLAMEQSSSNPVYYCQYAHARCASLLKLGEEFPIDYEGKMLKEPQEFAILKHLADFPSIIESAAKEREPAKMAAYVHKLAGLVHEFYAACRIIDRENKDLTSSRLGLIKACEIVLENGLGILGVSAPEKM